MTVTYFSAHRRLGPKSDRRENNSHPLCTALFAPVLRRFPLLHGSGAGVPGIGILIYSWYCGTGISSGDGIYSRSWDAEKSAWRAHGTDDWNASTVIKHCDERSGDRTHGSRENNGTVGVETAPRRFESRKARAVRTRQKLWRLGFHIQRIRGYTRSCLSCLAEDSETITNSGDGDSTTRTAVCNIAVSPHDAHTERSTESRDESWKQRFRSLQTTVPNVRNVRSGRQHGTVRTNHDVQVRFQDWRRGRPWNEFLELVRRYDEANGTDPVPDQVKKACIISNTPKPLKTHLQLNVAKLGNVNGLRVATEDYLRSRRIFKTTSPGNTHDEDSMEVDAVSRKGKGKEKSGKGKKGGKKGKESHSGNGYGETTTEHSRFDGECRNCGKYGHKASDCWYK